MVESPSIDHLLGTREEDWLDTDAEPGTEECAEAERRNEASALAVIKRRIQQRHTKFAFEHIPKELYDKAKDHHDKLTREEAALLLSRGDVMGKALAHPESLTTDEKYQVLRWPSPDKVRFNIQTATCGRLSTPYELYTKAKNAMDRGPGSKSLHSSPEKRSTAAPVGFRNGPKF